MLNLWKSAGLASSVVIAITFILFVSALFVKGFTHDLMLEAAVFLVSVKLIILSYRNSQGVVSIEKKLDLILSAEQHLEKELTALRNPSAAVSENS
jgi:uncharacterized membrane protein (Fun14 family)